MTAKNESARLTTDVLKDITIPTFDGEESNWKSYWIDVCNTIASKRWNKLWDAQYSRPYTAITNASPEINDLNNTLYFSIVNKLSEKPKKQFTSRSTLKGRGVELLEEMRRFYVRQLDQDEIQKLKTTLDFIKIKDKETIDDYMLRITDLRLELVNYGVFYPEFDIMRIFINGGEGISISANCSTRTNSL